MIKPEKIIIQQLTEKKQTLAVAESCTGGLVGHLLTNVPGSSACFSLGIISYSNVAKRTLLKVPQSVIIKKGAVSAEVARAMARGVLQKAKSDYSIAITGIAGPGGASANKPVGLVYIAIATPKRVSVKKCFFTGTRQQIKKQSATQALMLLLEKIKKPR